MCIQLIVTKYAYFYKNTHYYTWPDLQKDVRTYYTYTSDTLTLRIYITQAVFSLQLWNVAEGLIYHCSYMRENFSLIAYLQVKLYLFKVATSDAYVRPPFANLATYSMQNVSEEKHFTLYSMRPHQCSKHVWLNQHKWTSWRMKSGPRFSICCIITNNLLKPSKCNFQH